MEPLSSLFYSNERKAQKRPIPIITIDDTDDENEESLSPAVKRDKINETTPSIEVETSNSDKDDGEIDDETSSSESLKDDGEIEDELHDFIAAEISNTSNLTIDGDVQLLKDLIQDILKQHSLDDDKTSAEHLDASFETADNNKSHEIINAPNFELEPTAAGKKRLVIFASNDKTMCYKLYANKELFHCGRCWNAHKGVKAKVLKDENGEDYVQMLHQHLCQPVKYVPPLVRQQYETIVAPNYELHVKPNGRTKLVIFVPTNPNLCYYYQNPRINYFTCCECLKNYKKTLSAKLLKDQDGSEYVQAKVPHLCKPVPYVANKWNIIKSPNFFVCQPNQRLAVFNLDHPAFCYRYNYNKWNKTYYCIACFNVHRKRVTAKVIKDENGDECLQAHKIHLCEHFAYKNTDVFDILKSPNFALINNESSGSSSILHVYDLNVPSIRSTGYIFTQMENSYACSGCLSNGKHFMAKLFKDETGEEVVLTWKYQQHVCLPIICL